MTISKAFSRQFHLNLSVGIVASVALSALAVGLPATSSAQTTTRVAIVMTNCKSCTVTANSGSAPGSFSKTVKLRNGRGSFDVPTSQTRGLYFSANTPDHRSPGAAASLIVLRYIGQKGGSLVTWWKARNKTAGSPCWAGTTKTAVTLRITAKTWEGIKDDYWSGHGVSFWASPQLDTVPLSAAAGWPNGFETISNGAMGTQQNMICAV